MIAIGKRIQLDARRKELFALAKKARANAYAPHSGCRVGAVVELENGKRYLGCNVENASYGGTVCAERGALQSAICAEGKIAIREILVVSDASPPWMPCGLCRQVISEFAESGNAKTGRRKNVDGKDGALSIVTVNLKGEAYVTSFSEIYPSAFSPKELGRAQRAARAAPRAGRRLAPAPDRGPRR